MWGNVMRSRVYLLLITSAITIPVASSAEMFHYDNAYLGAAGELNILENEDVRNVINEEIKFKDGWGIFGTAGIRFNDNYRTELEVGYRDNKVKSIVGAPVTGSGHNRTWTFMANALYDFINSTPVTPYLGIGAGLADIKYSNVRLSSTTNIDDSSMRPAVQGIAGVSYKVTDNVNIFANYQYLTTSRYKIESSSGSGVATDQYKANEFLVGLRYSFGGNTQKPMVYEKIVSKKQSPAIARDTYLIFFDWDKDSLTKEGSQIVEVAAKNAMDKKNITLYMTGHADTSGTPQYNMTLSKRRATNVKNTLVKMGIPSSEIIVYAKGEADPLVSTGDGVREPQNRRVEIVYSAK